MTDECDDTGISASEHSYGVRIAVLEEKLKASSNQLSLQAREYERRLTDLNHAHEKQVKDQSTYISDDKFNGYTGEIITWRRQVDKTLAELEGRSSGVGSSRAMLFQVISTVTYLLTLAVLVWKR